MKSKIPALLLSLAVALGLWLYVVTNVSPESEQSYTGIPVVFENENSLLDRGLMLVSGEDATVAVRLYGSRANLNRLSASNITVTVDLKAITEPGKYELDYRISYPSGITNVSVIRRITSSVTVEVAEFAEKDVPVQLVFQGEQQEGLIVDQERAVLSAESVHVSGPKDKIDQVAMAGILIDRTGLTETLVGDFVYTLMNEDSEPVDVVHVQTDTGEIHLELPVEHIKEVPLQVSLVAGGGAVQENATCKIEPETISISGSEEALSAVEYVQLTSINLGDVDMAKGLTTSVEINLPDNLTNRSNVTAARVTITLSDLTSKRIRLSREQIQPVNVPAGMQADILTQVLDVTFRGPEAEVENLTADGISVTVDFTGAEAGTYTLPLSFAIPGTEQAGAYGKYFATVMLSADTGTATEPATEPTAASYGADCDGADPVYRRHGGDCLPPGFGLRRRLRRLRRLQRLAGGIGPGGQSHWSQTRRPGAGTMPVGPGAGGGDLGLFAAAGAPVCRCCACRRLGRRRRICAGLRPGSLDRPASGPKTGPCVYHFVFCRRGPGKFEYRRES